MSRTLRVRIFFFGLFASILAAVWIRALTLSLGSDAYATDLSTISVLLPFAIGAGFGSQWARSSSKNQWWIYYVIFALLGVLLIFWIPSFNSYFQSLSHQSLGPIYTLFMLLVFSGAPWFSAGAAFAKLTVGTDGESSIYLALSSIAGLFLLDVAVGPILGAPVLLLMTGSGIAILSMMHQETPALSNLRAEKPYGALIFALLSGFVLASALKLLTIELIQFFPGSRFELSWAYLLLLGIFLGGTLGAGSSAKFSNSPLFWAGLAAALTGSALALTSWILHHFSSAEQYLHYLTVFHADEGSLRQVSLIVIAIGGLPAFFSGFLVRRIFDPISPEGRPTVAASVCMMGIGACFGIFISQFFTIPHFGLQLQAALCIIGLIGTGLLGMLFLAHGDVKEKLLWSGVAAAIAIFVISKTPSSLKIQNPHQTETVEVKQNIETGDGIAKEILETGQRTEIWLNYNSLTPAHESLEKLEIALSLILAQRPGEILLLSPLTRLRIELLKNAGVGLVDLSPQSASLGELGKQIAAEHSQPLVTYFRAPLGSSRQYPLILALPEPLWPASASPRWCESTFAGIKERLTENGCFILWLQPGEFSASSLRSISRSFSEVFPTSNAIYAFENLDGPSFALVGRLQPAPNWLQSSQTQSLLENLHKTESFSKIPIRNVTDLAGFELANRDRILDTTVGATRNRGPLPQLSWKLSPRFQPEQQIEGLEFLIALSTSGALPKDDSPEEVPRKLLSGFIEHLHNQPSRDWNFPPIASITIKENTLKRFYDAFKDWPTFTPSLVLWEGIGKQLLKNNEYALCTQYFTQVAGLVPDRASFHSILGQSLFAEGKFEEAIKPMRRALVIDNKNAENWYFLGAAQKALQNYREAVSSLEEAHKLNPTHLEMLDALARSYKELGDAQRARIILEEAKKLAPHHDLIQKLDADLK